VTADTTTTTRVSGVIENTSSQPLAGITIAVGSDTTTTGSDGSFLLDFGTNPPPADRLQVHGEQATGATYPFIAEKIALLLGHDVYSGVNNVIARPIFLPPLDMADGQKIDPTHDMTVTTAAIPDASVSIKAGSLTMKDGSPFTGTLSITQVPTNLTPAALPADLHPDLVVTIQPGDMVFNTPAPLSLPNRSGYAPGTTLNLWSINPTTGFFDNVGTGVVSDDGSTINTVSGGVHNSSWHFFAPPPDQPQDPNQDPRNPDPSCDSGEAVDSGGGNSDVALQSGAVLESHALASYQSLGVSRGLTLNYSSLRADPEPIVHFGYSNVQSDPNKYLVAQLSVSRGSFTQQAAGFMPRTPQATDFTDRHIDGLAAVTLGGTAGQVLLIDNVFATPPGSSGDKVTLTVKAPNGTTVYTHDVARPAAALRLTDFTLPQTGTYTLSVSGGSGSAGANGTLHFDLLDVSNYGLKGGENFFSLPQGATADAAALQVNLTGAPSGVYTYTVTSGLRRFNGKDFAGSSATQTGRLTVVNSIVSPFGSGWGLAGLQQLAVNPDGSVLLIDGGGSQMLFQPPGAAGGAYVSPAGDFSTFVRQADGTFTRTLPDQTTYVFNAKGSLDHVRDRDGNVTQYTYDASGHLTGITDPVGLQTTFAYTGSLVTSITDPAGRVTKLTYDVAGNLTGITDPDNTTLTYGYDARHHLTSATDKRGNAGTDSYDFAGRASGAVLRDGSVTQFHPTEVQGLYPARATAFPFTAPQALALGAAVATTVDGNGNVTSTVIDRMGQAVSTSDALGARSSVQRNAQSLVTQSTDAIGHTTFTTYDATGNVLSVRDQIAAGASVVSGSIEKPGEQVQYQFHLANPAKLYFNSLLASSNFLWSLAGPAGSVVTDRTFASPDGLVGSSPTSGIVLPPQGFLTPPPVLPAGDYTLTVRGLGLTTGTYLFRLIDLASATALTPGTPVNSQLDPANGTEAYQFTARAGDRVFVDLKMTPTGIIGVPASARPLLIDPYGNEVPLSPVSFAGASEERAVTLTAPGVYTVLVAGSPGNSTGSPAPYTLNVQPVTDPPAQALTVGGTVSGQIGVPGQQQAYTFTLANPTTLVFTPLTTLNGIANVFAGSFDWSLSGPSGTLVDGKSFVLDNALISPSPGANGTFEPGVASVGDIVRPVPVLPAGAYTLTVRGLGDATGAFQFRLLDAGTAPALTPGTPVSGTLNPASSTDAYRLTANAGDRFFFDLQASSNTQGNTTFLRLVDPFGNDVFNNAFGFSASLTSLPLQQGAPLPATGTYTLLVEGFGTGTTSYRLDVQPVLDAAAVPLTLGSVVNGSIDVAGREQQYTFTLAAATRLYFDALSDNSSFAGTLTGPAGTVIADLPLAGIEGVIRPAAALSFGEATAAVLPAGNYTAKVRALQNATGAYSFRILDLAAATPLTPGTQVNGTLNPANDTAAYRFTAHAGDKFSFAAQGSSGLPALSWQLVDPYGNQVFAQDFSNVATQTLAQAGTYTLLVVGGLTNTGSGTYSFTVQAQGNTPPTPPSGTALTLGSVVSDSITTPGTSKTYTFTLAADSKLLLTSLTSTQAFNNVLVTLTGPAGAALNGLALDAFTGGLGTNPVLNLVAGAYALTLSGFNNGTGSYQFRLQDLGAASALTPGTPVTGTLNPAGNADAYQFTANAGDRFFFDLQLGTPAGGTALLRLVDPFGTSIFSAFPGQGLGSPNGLGAIQQGVPLPRTGTYTVLVQGFASGGGTGGTTTPYTLDVQPVLEAAAVALTPGTTVSDSIDTAGRQRPYTLTLAQPASLYFDAQTDDASILWSLDGPPGPLARDLSFATSDGCCAFNPALRLPVGSYTLTVRGTGTATGAYQFRLLDLAAAAALTPGTAVTATLNPANATDTYHFTANAGDRFFLGLQGSGFETLRLVDPFGNLVGASTNSFTSLASQTLTLAAAGTYTLLVEGNIGATFASPYTVNVVPVHDPAPVALTLGSTVSGQVGGAGEQERYTFTLANPTKVFFDPQTNNSFLWSLTGPAGAAVTDQSFQFPDGGGLFGNNPGGVNPVLSLVPGSYTLTVRGTDNLTGAYQFRLVDLGAATALTPGTAVNGTLTPGNGTDAYQFTANAGDRFFFISQQTGFANLSERLVGPAGNSVFVGLNAFQNVGPLTLSQAGTYTLLVEGVVGNGSGGINYTVNAVPVHDPAPVALTLGSTVSGQVGSAGEQERYTFTLTAAANLYFDSLTNDGNLLWTLTGPAGTAGTDRSFAASDGISNPSLLGLWNLPAGNYTLTVHAGLLSAATGSYQFRLLDLGAATALTPGTPVTATLNPANATDTYHFTAKAGDQFSFDAQASTGLAGLSWRLTDPYGNDVFNTTFQTGSPFNETLAQAGSYTLLIEGDVANTGSGSYTFNVQLQGNTPPTPPTGTALTLGNTVSDSIGTGGGQKSTSSPWPPRPRSPSTR
jgi:YD repeat-containing protein